MKWLVVGCFVWHHDIKFLAGFLHLASCMTLLLFLSMSAGFWRLVVAGLQRSFWREHPQKTPSFRWKNLQVRRRFPDLQRPSENALDDETMSPLINISSTAIAHQLHCPGSLCSSWCTLPSGDGSGRNLKSRHLKGSLHVVFVTWVAVLHHHYCSLFTGLVLPVNLYSQKDLQSQHTYFLSSFFYKLSKSKGSSFGLFFLHWIILLMM